MSAALALADKGGLTRDQVELLKRTIAKGATDDELQLFVQVCNRRRLDPFARQIYLVKRESKKTGGREMAIQTSIDGFRLIAQRSGEYRGQTPPQWCGPDGVWHEVWLGVEPLFAARIGVHRAGFVEPLYRIARWDSYVQQSPLWDRMPDVMIAKCAEALALRAAFPEELSGIYADDEMPVIDVTSEPVHEPAAEQSRALPESAPARESGTPWERLVGWAKRQGEAARRGDPDDDLLAKRLAVASEAVEKRMRALMGDAPPEELVAARAVLAQAIGVQTGSAPSEPAPEDGSEEGWSDGRE